jgi:hypothetical protein
VHWAPGIPRALCLQRAKGFRQNSGAPRERGCVHASGGQSGRGARMRGAGCVPTIPRKRWARRKVRLCATLRHCLVIARSICDEAIPAVSFAARWIASRTFAMTISPSRTGCLKFESILSTPSWTREFPAALALSDARAAIHDQRSEHKGRLDPTGSVPSDRANAPPMTGRNRCRIQGYGS